MIEGADNVDVIVVGGEELSLMIMPGRSPCNQGFSRQNRQNLKSVRRSADVDLNPIADHGQVLGATGFVEQSAAGFSQPFVLTVDDREEPFLLLHDASESHALT